MTHFNQIVVPLTNALTDTLGGWIRRMIPERVSLVQKWGPHTQSWTTASLISGDSANPSITQHSRPTTYVVPYMVQVVHPGEFSVYGDLRPDICDTLWNNDAIGLGSYNNVALQPAWHWVQDLASARWDSLGWMLYTGLPGTDTGVRLIQKWGPTTQSWGSRTYWDGVGWHRLSGNTSLAVYSPMMLQRTTTTIPGGGTLRGYCWPPLMR